MSLDSKHASDIRHWSDGHSVMTGTTPHPIHRRRLRVRSAHLVGIGGAGMRALAEFLQQSGLEITGSDAAITDEPWWKMHAGGVRVCRGHAASQLPDETDVLIYSPAIGADNPERRAAERLGIVQLMLPQALGWLMQSYIGVSVAGTHGKTTTTALLAHLLDDAGMQPSAICGGEVRDRGASGWRGSGRTMIVESCEYRRHFLELSPQHAILLNVDADHFDCFATLNDAIDAFTDFASRIPLDGVIVVNRDSEPAMHALRRARCQIITVGRHPDADWRIARSTPTNFGWSFVVEHRGEHVGRFRLPSPVEHNLLNSLCAMAMADYLGVPRHRLQFGLKSFAGVRRRCETIGTFNGVTLIDDYAHHPRAIDGVLKALRMRHTGGRVWCAFQPHQLSRTQTLFEEFAAALAVADDVLIPPVFAAREQAGTDAVQWAQRLAKRTAQQGIRARFVPSLDAITRSIETEARPGDLFLTLGAGDIDSIARDFSRKRPRQHAS